MLSRSYGCQNADIYYYEIYIIMIRLNRLNIDPGQ
jgi:hypothetical protein